MGLHVESSTCSEPSDSRKMIHKKSSNTQFPEHKEIGRWPNGDETSQAPKLQDTLFDSSLSSFCHFPSLIQRNAGSVKTVVDSNSATRTLNKFSSGH